MNDQIYNNSEVFDSEKGGNVEFDRTERPSIADNLSEILETVIGKDSLKAKRESLRKRLLTELSRYTGTEPDRIMLFAEPDRALETIVSCFLDEGGNALVAMPAETALPNIVERYGGNVRECYGESPFMVDMPALTESINESTGLLYIANPTRPAGAIFSRHELERLLGLPGEYLTIIDEAEFELSGIDCSRMIEKYPRLAIIRRFPNLLGMAATSGEYLLAAPELISSMKKQHEFDDSSEISGTAAMAALRSLDITFRDKQSVHDNMILMEIRLRGIGFECHKTPFDYILVKVKDPPAASAWLMAHGVSCRSLGHFHQLDQYLALNIGSDHNVMRTIDQLTKMPAEFREGDPN